MICHCDCEVKVLTVVSVQSVVLWFVTPSTLVEGYKCLGGTCCLHLQAKKISSVGRNRCEREKGATGAVAVSEPVCLLSWLQ